MSEWEHEEWREIPGYPDYEVSDLGRVRSWRWKGAKPKGAEKIRRTEPLILGPVKNGKGYFGVKLTNEEGLKGFQVHRLVLIAFTGEEPEGMHAAHGNGNPGDNRLSNLRWATAAENNADKVLHGTGGYGSNHLSAKLTEDTVREARGLYIPRHPEFSAIALAKKYGVSRQAMGDALTGKTWTRVTESSANPDDLDLTA